MKMNAISTPAPSAVGQTVPAMLDELYDLRTRRAEIQDRLDAEIKKLFAKEHEEMLDLEEEATEVEEAVKQAVLASGATLNGSHLAAVFCKGRVSWDAKMLDGMMLAVPALAGARKEGAPSVAIRPITGKGGAR